MAIAASKKGSKSALSKAMTRRPKIKVKAPKVKAPKIKTPKIKVDSKDVAKAAKGVGQVSAQVSEIAGGLETAASGKNGRHRSPVEVVLQGLTARR
jgi:X-X-X-Leu-X-X-Gly heptad repeat protein